MKTYNTIPYYGDYWGLPIIAFDKLDGSNLRFEFSQKRGFYKFGTRKMMIDNHSEPFGFAIDLFLKKYSDGLERIFKNKKYRNDRSFICYAELIGEKSSFGIHDFEKDIFDVVLFDIDVHKKGFISPNVFIDDFGILGIPKIVYEGNLNRDFINNVKKNKYNLSEGVICKGELKQKYKNLYYCKVKTDDWFTRLREKDEDLYLKEMKQKMITNTKY